MVSCPRFSGSWYPGLFLLQLYVNSRGLDSGGGPLPVAYLNVCETQRKRVMTSLGNVWMQETGWC